MRRKISDHAPWLIRLGRLFAAAMTLSYAVAFLLLKKNFFVLEKFFSLLQPNFSAKQIHVCERGAWFCRLRSPCNMPDKVVQMRKNTFYLLKF